MTTYTVRYSMQMACTEPSVTIPPPLFLPVDTSSTSFGPVSNYLPNAEIICSSFCNTISIITGQSGVNSFESCLNQTLPTSVEGKCFGPNGKVATSEGNSISWRGGKKKKTVSAGLLIALGIAGIVIGG